jgi:hypothetical protein
MKRDWVSPAPMVVPARVRIQRNSQGKAASNAKKTPTQSNCCVTRGGP